MDNIKLYTYRALSKCKKTENIYLWNVEKKHEHGKFCEEKVNHSEK